MLLKLVISSRKCSAAPTNEQADFLLRNTKSKVFVKQNQPVLLPLKEVYEIIFQPFSSVSGHQRYNTLDFPWKVVCQQERRSLWIPLPKGCYPPLWKPRAKELRPSGNPHIFLESGTQTIKIQFDTIPQKI